METDYYRSRRTIDSSVQFEGVGLHTGEFSTVELEPVEESNGIRFVEAASSDPSIILATPENVTDTSKCCVLEKGDFRVATVEHLLSALYALGVTDLNVRVDGAEIPAMDGGAKEFVDLINDQGLRELDADREIIRVEEPVALRDGESSLILMPSTELSFETTVSYRDQPVPDQFFSYTLNPDTFEESIAPARTYGFEDEIKAMLDEGLAQGGTLDNAVVVQSDGDYLDGGPKLKKEFARHKILDLIGDLALSEVFVVGKFVAVKPNHSLNVRFSQDLREKYLAPVGVEDSVPSSPTLDGNGLDIGEILDVLPHRYPFLLIDRVISFDLENTKAIGYKNVTMNEEFFQGHFPDDPVMPGVLIVEAMAQLGASCILNKPDYEGKNSYFMGLDDVKWRQPVRPGDRVYFEIEGRRMKSKYGVVDGVARVDGDLAAEATVKFAIVDTQP